MNDGDDIWFPAKRYGWGWGLPVAWQGWIVLLAYTVLIGYGVARFARTATAAFLVYTGVLTVGLIAICWWKGERPRWHWGGD